MTDENVLLVSAAEGNVSVMVDFLTDRDYRAASASTLDEFDSELDENSPDVALVDPDGFEAGIWERCERLRQQSIPFFVVSKYKSAAEQKGQTYQAKAIFQKPLAQEALLNTITQLTANE